MQCIINEIKVLETAFSVRLGKENKIYSSSRIITTVYKIIKTVPTARSHNRIELMQEDKWEKQTRVI